MTKQKRTAFRSRLVKVSIVGIPAILIIVWAVMVFLDAPRAYPTIAARYVTSFLLNKEGKNREVSVFEFTVTNWKKFELNLELQSVTQKDGDIQSFRVDLPRQEPAYSWGSFYWKSRFYVITTQEGSVAILNHNPRKSELDKLDYISPFREGELPENTTYGWQLGMRNYPLKRTLFAPDTRANLHSPGGGISVLRGNYATESEVSFWMSLPLPKNEKITGHCGNPNCTICRCDDPDCDRCRIIAEPAVPEPQVETPNPASPATPLTPHPSPLTPEASSHLPDLIANMLSDDTTAQQTAQQAWQDICMQAGAPGNEPLLAEVNRQAAEQLGKDIPVAVKVFLLGEVAWTGDASVVPVLATLLNDADAQVRDGALAALTVIEVPEAAETLRNALAGETEAANRKRFEDALSSKNVNLTVVVAKPMPMALSDAPDAEAQEYLAGFDRLSNDDKCLAIAALTARNDKNYRKYALDAIKSDNEQLKRAGLLALEKLGTSEDVPLLLDMLAFDGDLVVQVASRIVDDKFDDTLLTAIAAEKDNSRFESLARILAERHVAAVSAILLTAAKKDDCPNRLGYLQIAGAVATKENVGEMVAVMLLMPAGRDRDSAETVIAAVCKGDATPVLAGRNPVPAALFSLLGRIGGDKPRDIIMQNLKSDNASIRDAALKGLCNWPSATAANEMLAFAKDTKMPAASRTQALRAYVRVISLPGDRVGIAITPAQQLDALKEAMKMATGTPEKQLIIDRVSAIRIAESVTFAMQYIDTPALSQNVCRTVAELGRNVNLRRGSSNVNILKPALQKVLEVSTDNDLKNRVQTYLGDMQ